MHPIFILLGFLHFICLLFYQVGKHGCIISITAVKFFKFQCFCILVICETHIISFFLSMLKILVMATCSMVGTWWSTLVCVTQNSWCCSLFLPWLIYGFKLSGLAWVFYVGCLCQGNINWSLNDQILFILLHMNFRNFNARVILIILIALLDWHCSNVCHV